MHMRISVTDIYIYTPSESLVRNHEPHAKALGNYNYNRPSVSGNVHVHNIDIGCSDNFLVWMELGRTAKKEKRVIRRWH